MEDLMEITFYLCMLVLGVTGTVCGTKYMIYHNFPNTKVTCETPQK